MSWMNCRVLRISISLAISSITRLISSTTLGGAVSHLRDTASWMYDLKRGRFVFGSGGRDSSFSMRRNICWSTSSRNSKDHSRMRVRLILVLPVMFAGACATQSTATEGVTGEHPGHADSNKLIADIAQAESTLRRTLRNAETDPELDAASAVIGFLRDGRYRSGWQACNEAEQNPAELPWRSFCNLYPALTSEAEPNETTISTAARWWIHMWLPRPNSDICLNPDFIQSRYVGEDQQQHAARLQCVQAHRFLETAYLQLRAIDDGLAAPDQ